VQYRRQWQDVPYWHQVLEISVEGGSVEEVLATGTPENLRALAQVYRRMELQGDVMVKAELERARERNLAAMSEAKVAARPNNHPKA